MHSYNLLGLETISVQVTGEIRETKHITDTLKNSAVLLAIPEAEIAKAYSAKNPDSLQELLINNGCPANASIEYVNATFGLIDTAIELLSKKIGAPTSLCVNKQTPFLSVSLYDLHKVGSDYLTGFAMEAVD